MQIGQTWIESEERCYPNGAVVRRARVRIRANSYDPLAIPARLVGQYRIVRAGLPDTFFSIPARLRVAGRTIRGFVSVDTDMGDGEQELTFTPENRQEMSR